MSSPSGHLSELQPSPSSRKTPLFQAFGESLLILATRSILLLSGRWVCRKGLGRGNIK